MPQPSKFRCPRCKFRHSKDCGYAHGVETDKTIPGTSGSWMRRERTCPRCQCRFGTVEQVTEIIDNGVPLESLDRPKVEPLHQRKFALMVAEGDE